jgi:hypothetical protein
MDKDGENISKFSKEAMTLGDDVYDINSNAQIILRKVYILYDKYVVREGKVFPVKNAWGTKDNDEVHGCTLLI